MKKKYITYFLLVFILVIAVACLALAWKAKDSSSSTENQDAGIIQKEEQQLTPIEPELLSGQELIDFGIVDGVDVQVIERAEDGTITSYIPITSGEDIITTKEELQKVIERSGADPMFNTYVSEDNLVAPSSVSSPEPIIEKETPLMQ